MSCKPLGKIQMHGIVIPITGKLTNNETGEKMNLPDGSHHLREYETINDLNHPLYGAIKNITKEECINTEAVDEYGKQKN